jgi:hypothetical protein
MAESGEVARERLGPGERARRSPVEFSLLLHQARVPQHAPSRVGFKECGRRPVDFSTSRTRGRGRRRAGRPRSPGPWGSSPMWFPRSHSRRRRGSAFRKSAGGMTAVSSHFCGADASVLERRRFAPEAWASTEHRPPVGTMDDAERAMGAWALTAIAARGL